MTHDELEQALAIAQSDKEIPLDQTDIFIGFALPNFGPIDCTLDALAVLIRWQCIQFNGGIDHDALNEIKHYGRHRFMVLN